MYFRDKSGEINVMALPYLMGGRVPAGSNDQRNGSLDKAKDTLVRVNRLQNNAR